MDPKLNIEMISPYGRIFSDSARLFPKKPSLGAVFAQASECIRRLSAELKRFRNHAQQYDALWQQCCEYIELWDRKRDRSDLIGESIATNLEAVNRGSEALLLRLRGEHVGGFWSKLFRA